MLLIKTYVAQSEINGLGLFFAEDYKAGTMTWRYDSRCDRLYTLKELEALPPLLFEHVKKYGYQDFNTPGLWLFCGDDARYTNHSYKPVVRAKREDVFTCDVLIRDVVKGEEYTADYREWDADFDKESYNNLL